MLSAAFHGVQLGSAVSGSLKHKIMQITAQSWHCKYANRLQDKLSSWHLIDRSSFGAAQPLSSASQSSVVIVEFDYGYNQMFWLGDNRHLFKAWLG